jgi:outer membrane protein assembly factor BamB
MLQIMRILLCCCIVVLTACDSIEHRLEQPSKKELPTIVNAFELVTIWDKKVVELKSEDAFNSALLLSKGSKELYVADFLGNIIAIDLNGTVLWKKSIKEPITSGPGLFKDKLCVATATAKLICLSANKGEILWSSVLSSEALAAPGFSSDPMFDLVYLHTIDGGLSATNLINGRQVWRFSTLVPNIALRRGSAPVVGGNKVISGFANGKLFALNQEDGSILWSHNIANPKGKSELQRMIDVSADPVIHDNKVYAVSYQGNLTAISLNDGSLLWEREISSYSGLVVDDSKVYVVAVDGKVLAVDSKTGSTLWVQEDLIGRDLSKPVIINNCVVVGDMDGNLYFLNKRFGNIKVKKFIDSAGISIPPIEVDNILYILTNSGRLMAVKHGPNNYYNR